MKPNEILAYTVSYGDRPYLTDLVPRLRASSDKWFDWFVALGAPSPDLAAAGTALLEHPERVGIQYLRVWPENRGQHHATAEALAIAREKGYKWLLRIDDDVQPRTKRWLKRMIERLDEMRRVAGDEFYRIVAAPKIVGLRNPLQPVGNIVKGQSFPVEIMPILGGACRLHPVSLLADYEPPLYDPVGRGDPESIAEYLGTKTVGGLLVRFPDIRFVHKTDELEGQETPEQALRRRMGHYWPWLGATC